MSVTILAPCTTAAPTLSLVGTNVGALTNLGASPLLKVLSPARNARPSYQHSTSYPASQRETVQGSPNADSDYPCKDPSKISAVCSYTDQEVTDLGTDTKLNDQSAFKEIFNASTSSSLTSRQLLIKYCDNHISLSDRTAGSKTADELKRLEWSARNRQMSGDTLVNVFPSSNRSDDLEAIRLALLRETTQLLSATALSKLDPNANNFEKVAFRPKRFVKIQHLNRIRTALESGESIEITYPSGTSFYDMGADPTSHWATREDSELREHMISTRWYLHLQDRLKEDGAIPHHLNEFLGSEYETYERNLFSATNQLRFLESRQSLARAALKVCTDRIGNITPLKSSICPDLEHNIPSRATEMEALLAGRQKLSDELQSFSTRIEGTNATIYQLQQSIEGIRMWDNQAA